MQTFDRLGTKNLKLLKGSAAGYPDGFYLKANGGVGVSAGGVEVGALGGAPVTITADGAVSPTASGEYVITKAGVAALTLAAPTVDGLILDIRSATANAHTLTATGLLQTGAAAVNVATFAAQAGAGLQLMSWNGKWIVRNQIGITFS